MSSSNMASSHEKIEKKLYYIEEDWLICNICLDCYLEKDPRTLPCQHTFCLECLKQLPLENSQLTCPSCQCKSTLSENNINKMSKNFLSNSFKPFIEYKTCAKHKRDGSIFCLDHQLKNLCSVCFDEEHFDCEIIPMKRYEVDRKAIEQVMDQKKQRQENLLKGLSRIKENCFRTIEEKCENTKKDMEKNFNEFEKELGILERKNLSRKEKSQQLLKLNENNKHEALKLCNFQFELEFNENSSNIDTQKLNITNNIDYLNAIDDLMARLKDFKILPLLVEEYNYQSIKINLIDHNGEKGDESLYLIFEKDKPMEENCSKRGIFLNFNDIFSQSPFIFSLIFSVKYEWEDEEFSKFLQGVSASSKVLREIEFNACKFSEKQCTELSELLSNCNEIRIFKLLSLETAGNGLIEIVKNVTRAAKNLQEFTVKDCKLNVNQSKDIGKTLSNCMCLRSINFSDNKEMGRGFYSILEGLKHLAKKLEKVNFLNCQLTMIQRSALADFLKKFFRPSIFWASFNNENTNMRVIFNALDRSLNYLREIVLTLKLEMNDILSFIGFVRDCKYLKILSVKTIHLTKKSDIFPSLRSSRNSLEKFSLNFYFPNVLLKNIEANSFTSVFENGVVNDLDDNESEFSYENLDPVAKKTFQGKN